jgi:hypothetical protein
VSSTFPGDEYENEIEHLIREDGAGLSTGSGGRGWVNVLDPPQDLLEKYIVLGTGISGYGDEDDSMFFTGRPLQRGRRVGGDPGPRRGASRRR